MSHFWTVVLVPGGTVDVEGEVSQLLAPYDENIEVEEYEEACYCVGWQAQVDARKRVQREHTDVEVARTRLRGEFNQIKQEAREATHGEVGAAWAGFDDSIVQIHIDNYHSTPELEALKTREVALQVEWKALVEREEQLEQEYDRQHPYHAKADPDCEECSGTGKRMSTYNPDSQWDWWQVGGRWTGAFTAADEQPYEPGMDPGNIETCVICGGTGKRLWITDLVPAGSEGSQGLQYLGKKPGEEFTRPAREGEEHVAEENDCNACEGTGQAVAWSSQWRAFPGDVVPVAEWLAKLEGDKGLEVVPYALVTPDGAWHQRGKMGWWGMSRDDVSKQDWHEQVIALAERHADAVAVGCDLHI